MVKGVKKLLACCCLLALSLGLAQPAMAAVDDSKLHSALEDSAAYIYSTVSAPQVGSVGGEWAVLGLARSGYDVPQQYYQDYVAAVEAYLRDCDGILHDKKYTEYSRLVVALTAIGKDPRDVAGYNLLLPLGDFEKTIWQGLNGPVWALIALDSANYQIPVNSEATVQATRELYLEEILRRQLPDGGFSLFGGSDMAGAEDNSSDPDITGMVLQALAKYQERPEVQQAIERAVNCLAQMQDADGGYSSWAAANSESVVQVIVGLCEVGVALDDSRFIKNGQGLLDNLLSFHQPGQGFLHTNSGAGSNHMASEQGLYGLAAAQRQRADQASLYRMTDALQITYAATGISAGAGLSGKHADVQVPGISQAGRSFDDVGGAAAHANQTAIEALAARGIINGKSESAFEPDSTMTRAEFAAIVVRALGLPQQAAAQFADVGAADWYYEAVNTAYAYELVKGVTEDSFAPQGTISREAAAVMVARAAALCGLNTELPEVAIRDHLAQFTDYQSSSQWARPALAFCYQQAILDSNDLEIRPLTAITRAEVAQMLYNLLTEANLL